MRDSLSRLWLSADVVMEKLWPLLSAEVVMENARPLLSAEVVMENARPLLAQALHEGGYVHDEEAYAGDFAFFVTDWFEVYAVPV